MTERLSTIPARHWYAAESLWRDRIHDAIRRLAEAGERLGLSFCPQHDFALLKEIRRPLPDAPLNPQYDPAHCRLTPRRALWIAGRTAGGEIVTHQAIRIYDWHDGRTLATESRSMHLYYDDPAEDAGPSEFAAIDHPVGDRIQGRVALNGAVWVDPRYRKARPELDGAHLSQVVSPLSRLIAVGHFNADWCVATTKEALKFNGTADRYGWAAMVPGAKQSLVRSGYGECWVMYSRRDDVIAEAARLSAGDLKAVDPPRG